MGVPAVEVVILQFLLVAHLEHVVVQLGEHVEVGEGDVVPNEEGARFEMFLQMLTRSRSTFHSYLPSLRWDFTSQT